MIRVYIFWKENVKNVIFCRSDFYEITFNQAMSSLGFRMCMLLTHCMFTIQLSQRLFMI